MYSKIQSIAHCIYAAINNRWDSNTGAWKNQYNGQGLTTEEDIEKRIALVKAAIGMAKEKAEASTDVLKVFALPECFFQGKEGAYPIEYVSSAVEKLQALVAKKDWSDWVFAFGTINGVYDIGNTKEIVNLSPVVKGGFGSLSEAPVNTVVIQKARYCLELIKEDDIKGGGLTDKVQFGATQNEQRLAMLLHHVLKTEQQAKVEEVFGKAGVQVKDWPLLKKEIATGLENFGDTAIIRELRNCRMPDNLKWDLDWLAVARKVVIAAARPLKNLTAIAVKNPDKFKEVVQALVDQNNAEKVDKLLNAQNFPLARWAAMRERLQVALNDTTTLENVLNSQQLVDAFPKLVWGRDWIGATKKLLKLYVAQFKPVDIGSGSKIDEKEIDVLLSPAERGGYNADDFRFSFDSVVGPGDKKLIFGLEICADHGESKLKNALASAQQPPVDIQLIVSAGMTIGTAAIAVRAGGYLFNCDGFDFGSGRRLSFIGNSDKVEFTDPAASETISYEPHSEVRRHESMDTCMMVRIPLDEKLADGIFAKGAGNLHVYGAGAL